MTAVNVSYVDPEPPHLNYMEYIADEVNPQVQALKAAQTGDDDPSTKREERWVERLVRASRREGNKTEGEK